MTKHKKKLILIDSNALIHRAFHALPELSKKDGTLTNAVYGYALTLLSVLDKFKPDYIAATFDLKGPTFRHEKFEDYKATRKKAPDELYAQIPMVKEMLRAFNIPIFEKQGFEADDLIGTIAKNSKIGSDVERIIVTGDLDTLQLVNGNTRVFTLRRGITDTVVYDEAKVKERYGLEPDQMIEYKALRGDQSDNIPGVRGIGEKTAVELLLKYKTVEGVYENLEHIVSKSVQKKLQEGKQSALLSRELGTIKTDVPIEFVLKDCLFDDHNEQEILDFFQKMEFYSLAKRFENGKVKRKDSIRQLGDKTTAQKLKPREGSLKIEIVNKVDQLDGLLKMIEKQKGFAFEILADKEKFYGAQILGVGIYFANAGEAYFIPGKFFSRLKGVFEDKKISKIGYNVKFALELFSKFDTDINSFNDVQIQAYLLKSGSGNQLEKLVFEQFGSELANKTTKNGQSNLLSDHQENEKNEVAEKAFWILKLGWVFAEELEKISREQQSTDGSLAKVYENLELPLVRILACMELTGVRVDKSKLGEVSSQAEREIRTLEKGIYRLAGEQFNINSPSQLALILFDKLKIPTAEIRKGKTGFSTDAEQLAKIHENHPIVPLIEQYRELFKVKTTYADSLPLLIQKDGRIHANFNQTVAATGRLSSSDPNLQNIPKKGRLAGLIRQAFVAPKGKILVSADYSQIDLRVAAHLSGDPKMMEIFEKGQDFHRSTAAWVNGLKSEEVTDRQRSEAKSLNFGVLYGMGIYGFMRDSGLDRKQANFFIDQYMKTFSGLKKYLEDTKQFARQNGFVETEIGRRRYVRNITSPNFQLRSAAERVAINLPIQGLSADIMKLAMIDAEKLVRESSGARIILQIHDELIFEIETEKANEFMEKLKKVMESVYQLKVPLIVETSKGKNWDEL